MPHIRSLCGYTNRKAAEKSYVLLALLITTPQPLSHGFNVPFHTLAVESQVALVQILEH